MENNMSKTFKIVLIFIVSFAILITIAYFVMHKYYFGTFGPQVVTLKQQTDSSKETPHRFNPIRGKDYRDCTSEDLVGTWIVSYWYLRPDIVVDEYDPLISPYQYFFFDEQGK